VFCAAYFHSLAEVACPKDITLWNRSNGLGVEGTVHGLRLSRCTLKVADANAASERRNVKPDPILVGMFAAAIVCVFLLWAFFEQYPLLLIHPGA